MMTNEPFVDLAFPVTPGRVPIDHGYSLYAAIVSVVPLLHGAGWLGVHPLSGSRVSPSELMLNRDSRLTLRLPAQQIATTLPLSGQELRVGPAYVRVGSPSVSPLEPRPALFSWQVAIRLTHPPQTRAGTLDIVEFQRIFEVEAKRQLAELGISSDPQLVTKRCMAIKNQRILGFSIQVDGLTAEQSLALQIHGLGGKRRMGCGLFRGARSEAQSDA